LANFPLFLFMAAFSVILQLLQDHDVASGGLIATQIFLWIFLMLACLQTMLLGVAPRMWKSAPDPQKQSAQSAFIRAGFVIQGIALAVSLVLAVYIGKHYKLSPEARIAARLGLVLLPEMAALLLFGSALPAALSGSGVGLKPALKRAPRMAPALIWRLLLGQWVVFVAIFVASTVLAYLWESVLKLPSGKITTGNLFPLVPLFVNEFLALIPIAFTAAALAKAWQDKAA